MVPSPCVCTSQWRLRTRRDRGATNRQLTYNWFQTITPDPNWVCRPLRWLSPNSNINCKDFKFQLSYPNGMHYTCLPNTSPKRINTIWADQWTCLQLSNWMEHHSKWLQEESNMSQHSLQLTGTLVQMSSRRSNQIWVKHTKYQYRLNKLDAHPLTQAQLSSHQKIKCSSRSQHIPSTWSPNQLLENPNTPNSII